MRKTNKLNEDEVRNRLLKNNPHIQYVSGFTCVKSKAKFLCSIKNEFFESQVYDVYSREYCPICYKEKHGISNVINKLSLNNPDIEYLDGYKEPHKKAHFRCKKCGYDWISTASDVYNGKTRCPSCRRNLKAYTEEDIINLVEKNNPDCFYISGFTGSLNKAKFGCKLCGNEWSTTAFIVYGGKTACPKCASSKGEKAIERFLIDHNIPYIYQKEFEDCKCTYNLPFDFYIPSKNICIEYDGEFHFGPIKRASSMTDADAQMAYENLVKRDEIKTNYCIKNNIKLIRIPYTELKNINNILTTQLDIK